MAATSKKRKVGVIWSNLVYLFGTSWEKQIDLPTYILFFATKLIKVSLL